MAGGSSEPQEKAGRAAKPNAPTVQSTALFRAMNPELFIGNNKYIMGFGLITLTGCVAFIAYMNATTENKKETYMALNEDGSLTKRQKTSKWD